MAKSQNEVLRVLADERLSAANDTSLAGEAGQRRRTAESRAKVEAEARNAAAADATATSQHEREHDRDRDCARP